MNLSLDKIRIDCGTQSREKIDEKVVARYADDMQNGAKFPPIDVVFDGEHYYPTDGHHRYLAAQLIKAPCIDCNVTDGTLRDAILISFGANPHHGLPRTNQDKRKVVIHMLKDFEWGGWSDREIARQCNVSHTLVAAIRKEIGAEKTETKYKQGGKIATRQEKPKQEKQPEEEQVDNDEMTAAVHDLREKNEELQDQLTVALASSLDEIEKEKAQSIIRDLRAQIRALEIECKELTISRDMYQRENGELKKQVASLLKKLKKLEG